MVNAFKCVQAIIKLTLLSFSKPKKKYKINHHLNCNDKCLIYLLSCKLCRLKYIDSTTDKFCFRWNNYKENDRKILRVEEHMQKVRILEKCFKNCSSLWLKYFKLMVTSACFYTFFRGRNLFNLKCIFLNLSCVFCSEFYFCFVIWAAQ